MKRQLATAALVRREFTVNVLRIIVVLGMAGLFAQTYDFVNEFPLMQLSLWGSPYLFEAWFFGGSAGYLSIYPAWYPLVLIVLTIIGLRFKQ
jgi:hypothetical protein